MSRSDSRVIQLLAFCEWSAAKWIAENGGDDARYAARRVNTLAQDREKWTKPALDHCQQRTWSIQR
ncbi:hypothetical protein OV450_7266 [Actinobacteria bacterium OV450]|nr:hypothetical protein OV450_7266 [Actinobacteria bacterium OV450]